MQTSVTARRVAAYRLGFDRVAAPYGDPTADELLARDVAGSQTVPSDDRMARYLRARTSFFDQAVVNALERGVTQVAVIGAGYDGRSLRYAKRGVRWFEVDHVATQDDKRSRLERLGVSTSHLTFVAVDLRVGTLAAALRENGWVCPAPSLMLCEGVSVYLEEDVLAATLAGLRDVAGPGCRLAISLATAATSQARRRFREAVRAVGEPARNSIGVEEAAFLFAAAGWRMVWDAERAGRAGLVTATPA